MQILKTEELTKINGGASKFLWGAIAIGIVFIASAIYGFIHPNEC